MGTGAPTSVPCPECGTTYRDEQVAVVLGDVRVQLAAAQDQLSDVANELESLRNELAPIVKAFAALVMIPKVAKQLKNAQGI